MLSDAAREDKVQFRDLKNLHSILLIRLDTLPFNQKRK